MGVGSLSSGPEAKKRVGAPRGATKCNKRSEWQNLAYTWGVGSLSSGPEAKKRVDAPRGATKCDKRSEWQNSMNQEVLERILRFPKLQSVRL